MPSRPSRLSDHKDPPMPIAKARLSLAFGFLLFLPTAITNAAEPAFVGKLALIADPEVAKELGLTDDVKKKLLELIDKREQEAIGVAAKLKGQPAAKQAELHQRSMSWAGQSAASMTTSEPAMNSAMSSSLSSRRASVVIVICELKARRREAAHSAFSRPMSASV